MKLIVQDEDVVDKEDPGILNRMAQFASGDDVFKVAAAKQLLAAIERAVCCFSSLCQKIPQHLIIARREHQEDTSVHGCSTCAYCSKTNRVTGYRSLGACQAVDDYRESTVFEDPTF